MFFFLHFYSIQRDLKNGRLFSQVIATLKVAENSYRPTPAALRDLIGDMLQDLVTMYASMDDTRRTNNDYVVKEFYEVSQKMIENLKSCAK